MCTDGNPPISRDQTGGDGVKLNNQQGLNSGKRSKLNVFCSHRANCAKLNVQQWHRESTISRDRTGGDG
eukprot:3662126-Ditylum_brightwellii.AAC.1